MVSILFAVSSLQALAETYSAGGITVSQTRARPTVDGQLNGGAYMTLTNGGAPDRLIGVRTEIAASAEVHEVRMDGSVMRMRASGPLDLPTGHTVELKPGSYHVMLLGLTAPLRAGQHFPLILQFEKAGSLRVEVNVEEATH